MPVRTAVQELPRIPHEWWHSGGYKMRVTELDLEHRTLTLDGGAGHLRISLIRGDEWDVSYHLIHSQHIHESSGHVPMTGSMLRTLAGLPGGCHGDHVLARRFAVDVALAGAFVRKGNFLNIPCLGDGLDGNPSISIFISKEIADAVHKLLQE